MGVSRPALPIGTQVVLTAPGRDLAGAAVQVGATGRVVGDDGSRYRVELPDGRLLLCRGDEVERPGASQGWRPSGRRGAARGRCR